MFYKISLLLLCFLGLLNATVDIKKLETFEAQFTQTIESSSGRTIEYKGDVFIKNTGKILWKYKTPIEKNVYILNNFAIIDEPELEQAIYTQLQNEINIIKLLKSAKEIEKNKYLTNIDNTDYIIEVSNETSKISKISYKDKLENKIEINFQNSVENNEINDSVFKFSAPDYYDIIRK